MVSLGGADPHVEDFHDDGGARGLRPPYGAPGDLGWLPAAINFGDVRARVAAHQVVPGQGLEAFVPWSMRPPSIMRKKPSGSRSRVVSAAWAIAGKVGSVVVGVRSAT